MIIRFDLTEGTEAEHMVLAIEKGQVDAHTVNALSTADLQYFSGRGHRERGPQSTTIRGLRTREVLYETKEWSP